MHPVSLPIPAIIRTRASRRTRASHTPAVSLGWGIALLISLSAVGLAFSLTWGYLNLVRDLPSLSLLPMLVDGAGAQLRQPTRLFDRTGEQVIYTLQAPNVGGHSYLLLEALPPALITATLAVADPDFWSHVGYHLADASPTLAERLVADLLLWDETPSARRNWRARLLAGQATTQFGRKKILEWYLNSAPYGPGVYGIDAAARAYLGQSATTLSLAEAAFLVAASQRPAIHPVQAAELTAQRQTEILLELSASGLITPLESLQASQERLSLLAPAEMTSVAPAFTDLVLQQLATQFPLERLARGGLQIVTTLELNLQNQAACAVQAQLARQRGESAPDCEAARLLPTITNTTPITATLDAAVVILDPQTGQILALVGETSITAEKQHTAGSLLTPFVYLSAFARGFGPATLAWDVPGEPDVTNFDERYHGPLRLRTALANDYLVPAAQLFNQIGAAEVWRTLEQFGLYPDGVNNSFSALTSSRVGLLDAAHALSALAAGGVLAGQSLESSSYLHPISVLGVESVDSRLALDWRSPRFRPLAGAQLAYLLNHVLSDETARWPALGHPNPLEVGRPAAVKLSQTSQGDDTWAVGAIPQRMVGVWVGQSRDDAALERLSPASAAAIWHALVQYVGRDLPIATWNAPAGIITAAVCDPSGLLPTLECPKVVNEIFIEGNTPTRLDNLYRNVPVNRYTGLLATVFTPPSWVEERVYLNIPAQAMMWAQQAGLPIPPSNYDVIGQSQVNRNVTFNAPANFNSVRGLIELHGTASGDSFAAYRLLVGAGLNPQQWLQIGEEATRPVENGLLGLWDVSGLSGLYAVQLQVVRKDFQIETAILLVTVDNQLPEISLIYPPADQAVIVSRDGYLFFQAGANDNLSLGRLEFWVDNVLIGTLYPLPGESGPFTLAWKATPGQHRLQVIVFDRAGNFNQVDEMFAIR